MNKLALDHLAITAPSLAIGRSLVERALGVPLQAGGQHGRMGTHNALLKLGDDVYLEVIAIDPGMGKPSRARWFALDNLQKNSPVSLATWVARTSNIEEAVTLSPLSHGAIEPMSRGDLHWQITIPEDGSLPLEGACPGLIQWQGPHPATKLECSGAELVCLEISSASGDLLDRFLSQLNFEGRLVVHRLAAGQRGFLAAQINTPSGLKWLGGPRCSLV